MKQIIVVNEALQLPRGKLAAQVAHASVGAFLEASVNDRAQWLATGMTKIVLSGECAESLISLEARAKKAGIPTLVVRDAGRTVVPAGTVTCLGLGPAGEELLSALTGELRLV